MNIRAIDPACPAGPEAPTGRPARTGAALAATAVAALAAVAGGCASVPQPGQPLPGLRLDAVGAAVVLAWTPDSLVTRGLRPGTRLDIVADYPTTGGRVTGDAVGAGLVRPDQNAVQIALEPQLKRVPTGPVCLRIRLDGRAALPLRAGGNTFGTDSFQHVAWAGLAQANTEQQQGRAERERAQQTLAALDQADKEHAAWAAQLGATQGAQCERLSLVAQDEKPPRSVVEPQGQAQAAQRDCTYRYRQVVGGEAAVAFALDIERAFQAELRQGGARGGDAARAQLQRAQNLIALLKTFDAEIARPDYQLVLPLPASHVALQLTSTAGDEWAAAQKTKNFRKLYEPILDAFGSCLTDTRAQLDLSYQSWVRERQQAPALRQQQLELARAECRSRFQDADSRARARAALARTLAALDAAAPAPAGGISGAPLSLLRTGCP